MTSQSDSKPVPISLNPEDFVLPRIYANNHHLPSAVEEALDALQAANSPERIFSRGTSLVRIETDDDGVVRIVPLTTDSLRGELARAAYYYRFSREKKEIPAFPPIEVVKDILALPSRPFPVLNRVTRIPIFGSGKTLQLQPGYNKAARIYYAPVAGCDIPPVPQCPSKKEVAEARRLITNEVLGDFPFYSDADRANAVALIIQQAARELVKGSTPIYGIDKPTPGTGATLLCDAISCIITGQKPSVMAAPPDEAEMRRTIFAMLLGGPEIVLIDNVHGPLKSAALSAVATSEYYKDRRVGSAEAVQVPVRCSCVVTGNNLEFSHELARRTILIRMDAKMERPYERPETDFKHPGLISWILENRAKLVWAILVLIQNWIAQGCPKSGGVRLGSFESWSDTLGGILACAGIKGFLGNRAHLHRNNDNESDLWEGLVNRWWDEYGNSEVSATQLVSLAEGFNLSDKERGAASQMGNLLQSKRDCIFDGLQITKATGRRGHPRWSLKEVEA
jgi:putative DNA primase/helicase